MISIMESIAVLNFWLFVDKFKLEFKVVNKDRDTMKDIELTDVVHRETKNYTLLGGE